MKKEFPYVYFSIIEFMEKYFSFEEARDWNEIETMLSCTRDIDVLLDDAIASSEMDIGKAAYWSDIQYNAGKVDDDFKALLAGLDDWINEIETYSVNPSESLCFMPSDVFLNFNYTSTLQKLYGIGDEQVLYIHGRTVGTKVLGHNDYIDTFMPDTDEDWRIDEAKTIINGIPFIFF